MISMVITLSKTELELGADGKYYHKVIKLEYFTKEKKKARKKKN